MKFSDLDMLNEASRRVNTQLSPAELIINLNYCIIAKDEEIKIKFQVKSDFSTNISIGESFINVKSVKRKSTKINLTFEEEDFQLDPFKLVINTYNCQLLFPRLYDGY